MVTWSKNDGMFSEAYDDQVSIAPLVSHAVDWFVIAIFAILAGVLIGAMGCFFGMAYMAHAAHAAITATH